MELQLVFKVKMFSMNDHSSGKTMKARHQNMATDIQKYGKISDDVVSKMKELLHSILYFRFFPNAFFFVAFP